MSSSGFNYKGKTFVVTGGASGLGEAAVRRLAALGANVGILDRDAERGKAIAAELGKNAAFFEMDATKEDSIKKAIDGAVAAFPGSPLWGCVNSAGVGAATLTLDKKGKPHPSDIFNFVLQVNLYGVFNSCKYCAEHMYKNTPDEHGLRGVLVNVASVAAMDGQRGQVAYAASKGAVTQMTLPMARDLAAPIGIRVVTIAPGIMETPLMAAASDNVKKTLAESVAAPKRLGLPGEFALLCTSIIENSYLNGETIRLDGGIRMGFSSKI